jgi:hypothetical protein
MTPEAKAKLSKTIRALRERLLAELDDALRADYALAISDPAQAKLSEAKAMRRARLDAWVGEQVRALPDWPKWDKLCNAKAKKDQDAGAKAIEQASKPFRAEVVKQAAYTWLNRLVYLRLLEGMKLRPAKLLTGGLRSSEYADFRELAQGLVTAGHDESEGYRMLLELVFDELALDLPGLFDRSGLGELVPMRWSTLRHVIEAIDDPELETCWTDDMTLGWVYQYWNDPEREALDAKLNAGGKVANDEIASKTQMFTERYMVDWLLQNSLGPLWLAICAKHGWTPKVVAEGTLARLEQRRADWRGKRERGEVELTALMPLHGDDERRWAYYVEQPLPPDASAHAPESVRDIRLLDPAVGSGHFLVVALDLLVALYREEAEQRSEAGKREWSDEQIVESILEHNLHGIDLDPRAVQIAAAALLLTARRVSPDARPGRLNLVASKLRLSSLPADDPALVELRERVERDTGVRPQVVDALIRQLAGADHLGSLLKVDDALDHVLTGEREALVAAKAEQGSLFGGGFSQPLVREVVSPEAAKASLARQLEEFLAKHTSSADLGLRLRGEQLAAGVRFVRMVKEGQYHLVVGNPPYQGTSKMADSGYVAKHYPKGKADLYAAFLIRGLELVREGGVSALLTMRNWMFIKQYSELREWLLEGFDLRLLHDLSSGAFEEISAAQVVVSVVSSVFRRGVVGFDSLAHKAFNDDTVTTPGETQRKRATTLCHAGLYEFDVQTLKVVPEWPFVYWWSPNMLLSYEKSSLLGQKYTIRNGLSTQDNTRFLRLCWEPWPNRTADLSRRGWPQLDWAPYIKGAAGKVWIEPATHLVKWKHAAIELYVWIEDYRIRIPGSYIKSEVYYFQRGCAFSMIGDSFSGRAHRHAGVFGHMGASVFPESETELAAIVCTFNCQTSRSILSSLNPTPHFLVGDVARLPLAHIANAAEIFATLEAAFTTHESHREPSVEFRTPGPSPWRHAQDWAQLAVNREEGVSLPPYVEQLDPPPATDFISFALGVALGRFDPQGAGILDPRSADLGHALPHGLLFLDGTLSADLRDDGLGHAACALLHEAWQQYAAQIDTKRASLRDYLRLDFFDDVHRKMYENRPIHWPLSSGKKTFVCWVNIHRWDESTLRVLLADHLHPLKLRLDVELAELRKVREGADKKAARAADKRLDAIADWRDELAEFIAHVSECAERGPPPPDAKTPKRTHDAPYLPDLDDGVMINSAALWPLLAPQWKDPKKWWKELATAEGRKDYDWSHLAARYFADRVDDKCKKDPSLAVAHRCFWKYHPERAYAWELRLQDEIRPDFTIDEPDAYEARDRFFADHSQTARAIEEKEMHRRAKKRSKSDADAQLETEIESDEPDESELTQ